MKQQVWSSPKTAFEQFVPQTYIAACGDGGATYKFECNAPAGKMYVPDPDNEGEYLVNGRSYSPCSKTHETPVADTYYDGFIDRNNNGKQDSGEEVKVYLEFSTGWFGSTYVSDGHATANVNKETWEIAKS